MLLQQQQCPLLFKPKRSVPAREVGISKSIAGTEVAIKGTDNSHQSDDEGDDDEDDDFNFFGKSSEFLANKQREKGNRSGADEYINWIKDKQFIASDDLLNNKNQIQNKSSGSLESSLNKPFAIYEQLRYKDVRPYVRNDKKFPLKGYCKFFRNSQCNIPTYCHFLHVPKQPSSSTNSQYPNSEFDRGRRSDDYDLFDRRSGEHGMNDSDQSGDYSDEYYSADEDDTHFNDSNSFKSTNRLVTPNPQNKGKVLNLPRIPRRSLGKLKGRGNRGKPRNNARI
ncbi:unnamed protein product [[Candida] boidinii]|nr:unnamed protein product [[Candida] boidinii]